MHTSIRVSESTQDVLTKTICMYTLRSQIPSVRLEIFKCRSKVMGQQDNYVGLCFSVKTLRIKQ